MRTHTKPTLKVATALLSLATFATFCVVQPSTAHAQGTAFTYEGRFSDNGSPANGFFDITFSLWSAGSGPSQVGGTLTNAATPVADGLFSVTLDFGAGVFDGSDRWLQIGVRTNGGGTFSPLNPRQPITPTPYAILAGSVSGTIAAGQISGTISSNNIGVGSITTIMLANGAVGSNQLASGAVTTEALADGAVTADKLFTTLVLLSATVITNPTPLALDQFGFAVAVAGADKILVGANLDDAGATNAGAAHLYDAAGNLLVTLTNPSPAADDNFGYAVAGVGADKCLVGAYLDDTGALNAGSAYLFNSSGALLLTLANPSPAIADGFGYAVSTVGDNRLLIGSFHDNPGGGQFGAVYLYDLAGNLVQTITNPTPANLDGFGVSVTAVGVDKVLIGASSDDAATNNSGVAYLFSTNGTLLTTITNPAPGTNDAFGSVVAAVGTDKVLITAPSDDTGAAGAGSAYLFNLTGTLLATFTNPTPASSDAFGSAACAVGVDRVLIATAFDDTGAGNAGTAYLFDLGGNLLLTLTNPAPATSDLFGAAVAFLDSHRFLIGARTDDTGVNDAGAVQVMNVGITTPGLIADAVRFGAVTDEGLSPSAVTMGKLADGAVTAAKIADGAVTPVHLDPILASNTFWRLAGNAGTTPGAQFLGTTDNQPLEFMANNRRVMRFEPNTNASPNVIGGWPSNFVRVGTVGATIGGGGSADLPSVSMSNTVSGNYGTIAGGRGNAIQLSADQATIGGGVANIIRSQAFDSTIGGGNGNLIGGLAEKSFIGGGYVNLIQTNAETAVIAGGEQNTVRTNADHAIIGGGFQNTILADSTYATIGGGYQNTNGGDYATISGGRLNVATGNFSFAAGHNARATNNGAFVWSDSAGTLTTSVTNDSVTMRARGGYRFFTGSGSAGAQLAAGDTSWTVLSDRNAKKDIATVDARVILEKLAALPITQWHYQWEETSLSPHIGPMAQDFKAAFYPGRDNTGITTLEADGVALAAIQGLNQKLEGGKQKAESRIQKLEAENAALKERIEKLERLVQSQIR